MSVPGRPPAGGGVGAGHGLGGGHEAAGAGLAGQGAPVQPGRGRGRPARTRHRRLEQVGGEAGPGPAQSILYLDTRDSIYQVSTSR